MSDCRSARRFGGVNSKRSRLFYITILPYLLYHHFTISVKSRPKRGPQKSSKISRNYAVFMHKFGPPRPFIFISFYVKITLSMNTAEIEQIKAKITPILKKRQVALAYLFGSYAHGRVTPLSDIDVAVVFSDNVPRQEYFDRELQLMGDIGRACQVERVDVVNLATSKSPLLKHRAVFYGRPLLVTDGRQRFLTEHNIMRAYEDTECLRNRQHQIMYRQLADKTFGQPEIYVPTR